MPLTGTQVKVQLIPNKLFKTAAQNVTVVTREAFLEATVLEIGPSVSDVDVDDIVLFPYSIENANKTEPFIIARSIITSVETP